MEEHLELKMKKRLGVNCDREEKKLGMNITAKETND